MGTERRGREMTIMTPVESLFDECKFGNRVPDEDPFGFRFVVKRGDK